MNSDARAAHWVSFLAGREEFPLGDSLLHAFESGRITRLCDCGCNGFDFEVTEDADVETLAAAGAGGGAVFEMTFGLVDREGSLELIVFVAKDGHFSGIEVDFCSNSFPVPDAFEVAEPPYHVHSSESLRC